MLAKIFTLLCAAASVNAFTLPEEMGDGVFFVPPGSDKAQFLSPIDKSNMTVPKTPGHNKRGLPISEKNCYDGIDLADGTNYEQAKANLGAKCDGGDKIPGGSNMIARVGSVAVYGCSWGGENNCNSGEINEAMDAIDEECGNLYSGDVWMQDWAKIYGRGHAWNGFC